MQQISYFWLATVPPKSLYACFSNGWAAKENTCFVPKFSWVW
jgi:hypothetical protein